LSLQLPKKRGKRKTPYKHTVRGHTRGGYQVRSYSRGHGSPPIVRRRVRAPAPQGKVYSGWHSSPTGKLGVSAPEKSTEGIGYYVAFDEETAKSFGRKSFPVSVTMRNPLDARGEIPYVLHEADEVMEPPERGDSEWLSAVKEAVRRSGTTNENWGLNQAELNIALTDVLLERGYDGILIENWAVKFRKR
jgi:hypothetical protein